jgi:hypothetical protein
MADFAPNFTGRVRIGYKSGLRNHHMTLRYPGAGLPSDDTLEGFKIFFENLGPLLVDDAQFMTLEAAVRDSDLFLPVSPPTSWSIDPSATVATLGRSPSFVSFQGRSTEGARASIMVMGTFFAPPSSVTFDADYRAYRTENALVETVLSALEDSALCVAIDGNNVFWHPYINIGIHSHYQKKARG